MFFWVSGCSVAEKSRLDCATGAAILALPSMRIRFARAVELKVPGDFFSSLWMLCDFFLHVLRHFVHWNCCIKAMCSTVVCCNAEVVLRHFVHWNCCIKAMCSTVVCCNSIVFFKSVSADRNGMAAPRCLERYLVSSSVLRLYCVLHVILGRSHWNCYIMGAI